MADNLINVEVAYARPDRQTVIPLGISADSTLEQAIDTSGILQQFPEIDLSAQKVGIFSQLCSLNKVVSDGDRIEIYRPLQQNPMDARRSRLNKP